ncbi:Beige/BEACH domain containing protein [Trichomonas vaginalis G3]|uniref:Beige/BEACH domain containing protein n=1 Tax=Trichomonas vaginalis (strain ATCC PRA-98 / G3) TaxID=412133 RepID=A2FN74_TRIV3|nr:aggrephagy protein [Trichomonas vaginalis G3]EAX93633.1 Beige/BEACH domain containing protein [Trichomonas vaginalis G3]KAI5507099.1 aggrephagy protein [Trichomonas vaginalis G3]|eukprot:XP_001306563.1 Beige/BEACH domain containing protein [Trichomonas vaginalis G3]
MSLYSGDANFLLEVANKYPEAASFFNRFSKKDLFSLNWKQTKEILDQLKPIPDALVTIIPELGMTILAKYIAITFCSFFPEELFQIYLLILDKLPSQDLDLIIPLLVSRLSIPQRKAAIFKLPDCGATFMFLGSLIHSEDLFITAFQRIFSSIHLIPQTLQQYLISQLRKTIENGVGRSHITEIIEIATHYKTTSTKKQSNKIFSNDYESSSSLDIILTIICDYYPHSLVKTDPKSLQTALQQVFKLKNIPLSALKLVLLTNSQVPLTFKHIYNLSQKSPNLVFDYLSRLTESDGISAWYQILSKISMMEVNIQTREFLINCYEYYLIACHNNPIYISAIQSSGTMEWFIEVIGKMTDSMYHITIFSLFLLLFRSFGQTAKFISSYNEFQVEFESSLQRINNKILYYDAVLWILDEKRSCPFKNFLNSEELEKIKFPPPSSPFVFEFIPIVLTTLMKIAVADSTPKNIPQSPTTLRMNLGLERTHSQVKLLLDVTDDEDKSDNEKSDTPLKLTNEISNEITNEGKDEIENMSIICPVELNTIQIKPLLSFFLENLIPMYENDSTSFLIHSLSSSQVLLPLLPLAEKNDLCFQFLTRSLALSCPFPVFAAFYEQISYDFKKILEFLASLAEYSQLVTDFLYITSPIPLATTVPCNTICLWVRPLSESNILTITTKFNDLTLRLSSENLSVVSQNAKLKLPQKIGGWIMISAIFLGNTISITANTSLLKLTYQYDVGSFQNFTLGNNISHFDLQSVRVFKNSLSDDDILHLFSLGPNYMEFVHHNLNQMEFKETPQFITKNGYVSSLYLPFLSLFEGKSFESNCLSLLELSLSPPFKMVRHLARGPQKAAMAITVDRRRSYSFMNCLQCHGGLHLLIHFCGEIILKKPELSNLLWKLFNKLFNTRPDVYKFFEQKNAFSLVGHLLWSGNIKLDEVLDLTMKKYKDEFILTNPLSLREWIFEGLLFHSESHNGLSNIIESMKNPRNFKILKEKKTFDKIINILCSSCKHSKEYLDLLGKFAVGLTEPQTAQEYGQLVFDRLILYHLTFDKNSNESKMLSIRSTEKLHKMTGLTIQPITTVSLIKVLSQILTKYPEVKLDLELLLPGVVTSPPIVQVTLVTTLIKHLSSGYLQLLGHILKILKHIEKIEEEIFNFLNGLQNISFVQLTTCFFSILLHKETSSHLDQLCLFATEKTYCETTNDLVIAMNQILDVIRFTELSNDGLPLFDNSPPSLMNFMSLLLDQVIILNSPDLLFKFFLSLFSIPGVALYRLATVCFTTMTSLLNTINKRNQCKLQSVNQAIVHITTISSFLIHKLRLTPGAINPFILNLIESFISSLTTVLVSAQNTDLTSRLVNFLADLFHVDVPQQMIAKIKQNLSLLSKASKAKRYSEMMDRMDEPSNLTPNKFIIPFQDDLDKLQGKWLKKDDIDMIALFSISCKSIHHQTQAAVKLNIDDNDGDNVIDLWHETFHILQFPGSQIFNKCPTKWMVSDRSLNFQQRSILIPMNPSIDKPYIQHWEAKYGSDPIPEVRLTLKDVLKYTPVSLHMANDVEFSSHALRLSGISNIDGVLIVSHKTLRFYQRVKQTSQTCDVVLTIQISKIVSIRLKTFRHQQTGVEIACKDATCYIFAFDTANLREIFVDVMENRQISIIKNLNKKDLDLTTKHWVEGQISNFDYLLYLNSVSGRSWYDFTQYPIFPWVIKNYKTSEIDLNDSSNYRDFTYPIFAQTNEQKEQCISYYNTTASLSNEPHCTPNYISNVGSTIYFLVRAEPFTDEEISFQNGSLDAADRTFQSFDIAYQLMTAPGNKNALELVPEFYFNPELLKNINKIEFPYSPITGRTVDDVVLPDWALSHREFVQIMRKALESSFVSSCLNEWIDLVWGFRRKGENALERCNVFQSTVYQFDPRDVIGDRVLYKALSGQIHNCGQAAQQLFDKPHPKRNDSNQDLKGELIFHSLRKPIASERNLLQFSLNSDRWIPIVSDKTQFKAFRLVNGSIEANKNGQVSPAISFSDDIAATCFDVMGTTVVTGHAMPVINLWKVRDTIDLFLTIRGHLVPISAVSIFGQPWSMLASGHEDGCVSLFSMCPTRFLRVLRGNNRIRVSFIRVCIANGDIIVCQSKEGESIVTLWSVNGEFVNRITLESQLLDCVCTTFVQGVRHNFIFVLGSDSIIYVFKEDDLMLIGTFKLNHPNPVSMFLEKDKNVLFITHSDGFLSCWKIV